MKKLCWYVIISLTFAVQHVSADTAEIQRMLNLLGFEAGTADGIYGKKTENALIRYYTSKNRTYDGNLDENEFNDLKSDSDARPKTSILSLKAPTNAILITNWKPIGLLRNNKVKRNEYGEETYSAQMRRDIRSGGGNYFDPLWETAGGKAKTTEHCTNRIAKFDIENIPGKGKFTPYGDGIDPSVLYRRCVAWLKYNWIISGKPNYDPYEKILLSWATAKKDPLWYTLNHGQGVTARSFQYATDLGDMSLWYATTKPFLSLKNEEKQAIETYLKKKWLKFDFMTNAEAKQKCPVKKPHTLMFDKFGEKTGRRVFHNMNNCGDPRINGANGQLSLAAISNDKKFWKKAISDVAFHLNMIDQNGFFVPHASRGCMARGYMNTLPEQWSLTYEILRATHNFNFWEHTNSHGTKMKDALVKNILSVDGQNDLGGYPLKVLGSDWCLQHSPKYIKAGWNPKEEPDMLKGAERKLRHAKGFFDTYGNAKALEKKVKFMNRSTAKYSKHASFDAGWMPISALELNYGNTR